MTIAPSEPDPLQLRAGESTTLRCTVPETTPISAISWTRPNGDNLTSVTQLPHGLLLALSSVTADNTDTYTCSVTDVNGNTMSQDIEIQVLSKAFRV